jgi:hypothetical protein
MPAHVIEKLLQRVLHRALALMPMFFASLSIAAVLFSGYLTKKPGGRKLFGQV